MRKRILGLLGGYKKQMVLEDLQQLDLDKLAVPRAAVIEEVEAAQRTIIRAARVLLGEGHIQFQG